MRGIRVSPEAKVEIRDITAHSSQVFGASAAARYAELIKSGFRFLARTPDRPGVRSLGEGRHLFHLRLLTDTMGVKSPRHVVVFRYDEKRLYVLHVFHNAMDLPARLRDL